MGGRGRGSKGRRWAEEMNELKSSELAVDGGFRGDAMYGSRSKLESGRISFLPEEKNERCEMR